MGRVTKYAKRRKQTVIVDMYFLDKGALIIGFADKRSLIQRALL